jgi:hypothetical protein
VSITPPHGVGPSGAFERYECAVSAGDSNFVAARLLLAWQAGAFELIVSPGLLAEIARALGHPKLRRLVAVADADAYVEWLERSATVVDDPRGRASLDPLDPCLVSAPQ